MRYIIDCLDEMDFKEFQIRELFNLMCKNYYNYIDIEWLFNDNDPESFREIIFEHIDKIENIILAQQQMRPNHNKRTRQQQRNEKQMDINTDQSSQSSYAKPPTTNKPRFSNEENKNDEKTKNAIETAERNLNNGCKCSKPRKLHDITQESNNINEPNRTISATPPTQELNNLNNTNNNNNTNDPNTKLTNQLNNESNKFKTPQEQQDHEKELIS